MTDLYKILIIPESWIMTPNFDIHTVSYVLNTKSHQQHKKY